MCCVYMLICVYVISVYFFVFLLIVVFQDKDAKWIVKTKQC